MDTNLPPTSQPPTPQPVNEQISSLGINLPPQKEPKKVKTIIALLGLLLLVVTIPAAIFVVKQRQEIRKEAAPAVSPNQLSCARNGLPPAGYQNPAIEGYSGYSIKFWRKDGQTGDEVLYRCDYQTALQRADGNVNNIKCEDGYELQKSYRSIGCDGTSRETGCYTRSVADFIDPSYKGGKCQVIQVDLAGCDDWNPGPPSSGWQGGVAFVIAYNDECPEVTSTPTPTSELTSTPTPTGPTSSPTPTPTGATGTPTPTGPTPIPTPRITACFKECASDSDCDGGLSCLLRSGIKRCLNKTCEGEDDCTCNKSCWEVCGHDSECPTGLSCVQQGSFKRCINSACPTEQDCNCLAQPQATPTQVALPEVGITPPTWGIIAGGALLIITSLLLAL